MEHLHYTPPRRSATRRAIDESARWLSTLTPVRGRRSITAATSSADAVAADFRYEDNVHVSSTEPSAGTEENECCICFEVPGADNIASTSVCGHTFCDRCIIRWSNANNVCPLCRVPFTSIVLADGTLHRVLVRPRITAELLSIVTDADINNARTFILGEGESRGGDITVPLSLSEGARGSFLVAYWGVIAAAHTNALDDIRERNNQVRQRKRELVERIREVEERIVQKDLMYNDLVERADNLQRLISLRRLGLNEAHSDSDDTWSLMLNEERQEIKNGCQQVRILRDRISDEVNQLKDVENQLREESNQIDNEWDQIDDEWSQLNNDLGQNLASVENIPTPANLSPSLRSAVQRIDDENLFELTRQEVMANLWG